MEEYRPANYDTDQDGMPDWWEKERGLDVNTPDNNKDEDRDGYTALEDYLNWLADPHYIISNTEPFVLDLKKLFAGFDNEPSFEVASKYSDIRFETAANGAMTVTPGTNESFYTIQVTATDKDNVGSMTRNVHFYTTSDEALGICIPSLKADDENTRYQLYTVGGILISEGKDTDNLPAGTYILKIVNGKQVRTMKVRK